MDTMETACTGHLSSSSPLDLGVPERSILGPNLFIVFMNDLGLEIHNLRFEMYAKDSSKYTSTNTLESLNFR